MKNLFRTTLLLTSLITLPAFAVPKIIYKDMSTHQLLMQNQIPQSVQNVIQDFKTHPDTYEIVVQKFKDHYSVYQLSNKVWGMKKIRINLNGTISYNMETDETSDNQEIACPDNSVQFLAISAFPGVGSVNEAIKIVSEAAQKKYKTMTILDENADAITYKNWLSCPNLKAVYSIGHGSSEGIMVGNGDIISYDYFSGDKFNNNFKNTTVFINACQVFNYPFGTELIYGNATFESDYKKNPGPHVYQYLGGEVNLLMMASELSSACLMAKAIDGKVMNYETLKECTDKYNLHYQDFGLAYVNRVLR